MSIAVYATLSLQRNEYVNMLTKLASIGTPEVVKTDSVISSQW